MLRVGIIGSGFGLYGLLPAFNLVKNCRVVSICGKRTERLVSYCDSIGLNNIYSDWEEMLAKENLDAVVIAVTPKAQFAIAERAIKMGLHVFAEKPLAVNFKSAKKLYVLAEKNKITNVVDFIFPEIPEWKKVKELLDKKTYGKLLAVSFNWDFESYDIKNRIKSWKTDISEGGGALSFYASHYLYALENFAGEISNFKSMFTYSKESLNGAETGVDLFLEFNNGALGQAHISCASKGGNKHKLIFVCEQAEIVLENIADSNVNFSIKIHKNKKVKSFVVKKEVKIKNQDERVVLVKSLASRFVNSALKNEPSYPSFKEGLRVQYLIEKIRTEQIL